MAKSRLEIQKQILENVNARVDALVSQILLEAETARGVVDVAKMDELDQIIEKLERMDFRGDTDLLRQTKAVYDKAIATINEQLEAEESKEFEDYSIDSLKAAKELLEKQSESGRVGTMISRLDELSRGEASGTIEKKYNDGQIEELDYSIREREEEEKRRIEPFNKILHVTRAPIDTLNRYLEIQKQINEIDEEIKGLEAEIAKPETEEEDKKKSREKIKALKKKKTQIYQNARKDEKDNEFEMDKTNDKTLDDYFKRVQAALDGRINESRLFVIDALNTVKDEEIDIGAGKIKISEYLKDYMDVHNLSKVDELKRKLQIDKDLTKKSIEQEEEHKDMDELKKKRQVYENRNKNIERSTTRSSRTTAAPVVYEKNKFDWKHPFKSIANWFNKGSKQNNKATPARKEQEKFILEQIDKEMGRDFRKQFTVEEKDRITVKVEHTLNEQREEFYRQLNNKNQQSDKGER